MPLWAALRFVQWEDTIHFHARLFRCFFLGFLDTHSELAVLPQGSEWMLAILGQRLADVGLMHDVGHLHELISHRASPLCLHDGTTRAKRRYETTSLPSFKVNSPTDPTAPIPPPFVFSHPIDFAHGLYDQSMPPAVAFAPPGSGRVPGGYDSPPIGVVGFILLGLLTLAIIISRCASKGSGSARAMCLPPRVAVESSANSSERMIRPLLLPMDEATQRIVAGTLEDVSHQASMPGAWLFERQEQSMETLEESVFDTMPWTLFYSRVQMGMKAWAYFPDLTSIFEALEHWNRGSNDVVVIERESEDGCSPVCQGLDACVSIPAVLHGSEQQGAAQDHLPSDSGLSIKNLCRSTTTIRCEPLAIGCVATKDPDLARTTTLDVVCGDGIGLTFALVASSNAEPLLCQEDMSSDVDDSASEDGSDEGSFGVATHCADMASLERKDEYRILGRRQGGALSDTGCPLPLRGARSSGYPWKKRDVLDDDDEGTDDDSYWTEQVNAGLSGERNSRRASCRYSWSDVSSWPRKGQEDETDNWRTRSSQVTQFATPEETSDAVRCQADGDTTKLRRYPSAPLNVGASLSDRAGSGDGPQGIYVVPQKRRWTTGDRCWSPISSPRPTDRPSGLGFFPFRRTPSLLTPEAWRLGCLYIPDPPEDEARQADAWWDNLTSVDSRGSASGAGHRCGTRTVIQDAAEQGTPVSQDVPDAPVSWRDRYENDPATRRLISVHRRAMTEG